MAEGKKTFIFYSDWINMVSQMPDKEAGVLLKHILEYVNDKNPKTDNLLVKMAFGHMKPLIKADLKKWDSIREKRKEAGAKGGKRTQANAKQNQANAKQVQPVNDNVNINTTTTIEAEVDFLVIDNWIKQVSKSEIYLEGLYRLHKLNNGAISELTKNFKEHLKIYPKKHINFSDFKKHFAAWLQIKNSKGELSKWQKQTKGQL
jgi:hypothetical protein